MYIWINQDGGEEIYTASTNKTRSKLKIAPKDDGVQLVTSEESTHQYTQEGWEQVLTRFWKIAKPYWTSDQKGDAIRSGLLVSLYSRIPQAVS